MAGWEGYRLVIKLKKLKLLIKDWASRHFKSEEHSMAGLLQEIQEIDNKEGLGLLSTEEFLKRLNLKLLVQEKVRRVEIKWR